MPSVKVTAIASGFGGALWNAHINKKAELLGLSVDNKSLVAQTVTLYDGFATTSGRTISGAVATNPSYLGTSNVLSGIQRLAVTVAAGGFVNLGQQDLGEVIFLGRGSAIATQDSTSVAIVARYKLR